MKKIAKTLAILMACVFAINTSNLNLPVLASEGNDTEIVIEKKSSISSDGAISLFTGNYDEANPILKIGFFFGSNTVPTTNLLNYDEDGGVGYDFGYFDDRDIFNPVFTEITRPITTMKDANIYLGTDGLYYDYKISSYSSIIGAYHLELSETFSSQNDAEYRASTINDAFVAYIDGVYKVRVGSYISESDAKENSQALSQALGGASVNVAYPTDDTFTVTETFTDKILFEYSNDNKFAIMPDGNITWNKGYRYYGAFEYARLTGGDLTVVNVLPMQEYIKGVLPYEMSSNWHIEALKAQALTARSYAFNNMNKHSRYGFDLCNTTDCQVYRGTSQASANSDMAVDDTYGEFISYDGKIATGFFYSSNGGATENSENVWNEAIPYLVGKIDPYERSEEVNNGVWEYTMTEAQVESKLLSKGYSINGVSDMYIAGLTDMGNVNHLVIVDDSGKKHNFYKDSCRTILGVNSIRYRINEVMPDVTPNSYEQNEIFVNGQSFTSNEEFYVATASGTGATNGISSSYVITASGTSALSSGTEGETTESVPINTPDGTFVISGRGWGHQIGMSQYGALHMAEAGFTYEDIVTFYYDGTQVTSH